MLPSTLIFTVVSPILIMTAIVIMAIGLMYRIKEQIIGSIGYLFLGLSFVTGLLALNKIDETLIIEYGWKYQYVKLLEAGIINPFKGPISPSYVQIGSWSNAVGLFTLTSIFLVLGAAILSYIGMLMIGFDSKKAVVASVIVVIIGGAGIYYLNKAVNVLVFNEDIVSSLAYRDLGSVLRGASIIIAFAIITIGAGSIYLETKTRDYLLYAVSSLFGGIGWSIFSTSWTTHFEKLSIFQFIYTGQVTTPVTLYIVAAFFIVIGSIGLLLASIIEIVASTMAGVEGEEVLEATELEEVEVEEA